MGGYRPDEIFLHHQYSLKPCLVRGSPAAVGPDCALFRDDQGHQLHLLFAKGALRRSAADAIYFCAHALGDLILPDALLKNPFAIPQ
jgi:hypothetical protein